MPIFRALLHLPPAEVSKHAPGDLLKRVYDDAARSGSPCSTGSSGLAAEPQQPERMHSFMLWMFPARTHRQLFFDLNFVLGNLEHKFVTSAVIYFIGGLLIFAGRMTLGSLIVFVRFFRRVVEALVEIGRLTNELATLGTSAFNTKTLQSSTRFPARCQRGRAWESSATPAAASRPWSDCSPPGSTPTVARSLWAASTYRRSDRCTSPGT